MTRIEKEKKIKEIYSRMPWFFVLTNQQLYEKMAELNVTVDDICHVCDGFFCLKKDLDEIKHLANEAKKIEDEFRHDKDNLYKEIIHEFEIRECYITGDPLDAINALHIELSDENMDIIEKAWKSYCYKHREIYVPVFD